MTMIFVRPVPGARVRMPERGSAVMTAAGAWVTRNVHYEQLLQNKDVVLADPQPDLPKAADTTSQAAAPVAEPSSSQHRTHAPRTGTSKEK